jgi:hypothetical protein
MGTGSSDDRYVVFRVGDTANARQILCDGPNCSPNVLTVDRADDDIFCAGEEYRGRQTRLANDRAGERGCAQADAETGALKCVCGLGTLSRRWPKRPDHVLDTMRTLSCLSGDDSSPRHSPKSR